MNLGFTFALVSAVLFGLYMVPRKLSRLSDYQFLLGMGIGVLTMTALAFSVSRVDLTGGWREVGLAYACGFLWALATLFNIMGISRMGLAISTPIKNTSAILGPAVGMLAFAEYHDTQPVLAVIGAAFIVVCAVLIAAAGGKEENRGHATWTGVVCSVLAAIFYAAYTIPFKMVILAGVSTSQLVMFMGQGAFVAIIIIFLIKERTFARWAQQPAAHHWYSVAAGGIWSLAVLSMAGGIKLIGLSVTWPIANLNTVVAVLFAILFFREIDLRKYSGRMIAGLLCALAGVLLLAAAKSV